VYSNHKPHIFELAARNMCVLANASQAVHVQYVSGVSTVEISQKIGKL